MCFFHYFTSWAQHSLQGKEGRLAKGKDSRRQKGWWGGKGDKGSRERKNCGESRRNFLQ